MTHFLLLVACSNANEEPEATPVLHQKPEALSSPAGVTPESATTVPVAEAVWRVPLGGAVNVAPVIGGGLAIVATAEGQIHAVEAASGVPAWNFGREDGVWDASLVVSDD